MGLGLGLRFGCDFGGWGLRLWAVVTVTLVVVTKAVVEWVLWLVGCGGWVFFFFPSGGGCWWLAVGVWMWVLLG